MGENELITYKSDLVKSVSGAISIANRLLAVTQQQLIPYRRKNKWGFCTPDKKIVIECIYDDAFPCFEGRGQGTMRISKWIRTRDLIESNGNIIFSSSEFISDFYDGLANVRIGEENAFINTKGDIVIQCSYDTVDDFFGGLALVSFNRKYGFIDQRGVLVIPCIYDKAWSFLEGRSKVEINGKRGYINKKGNIVVPCIYDDAGRFSEGLAWVEKDGILSYINREGEIIITFENAYLTKDFSEGLASVCERWVHNKFVDKTGNIVIPNSDDYYYPGKFSQGLTILRDDIKYGFINKSGSIQIQAIYDHANDFSEGLAAIKCEEKWGFINKKNEIVIPCIYDEVYHSWTNDSIHGFSDGLAIISYKGQVGFVGKDGVQYWED